MQAPGVWGDYGGFVLNNTATDPATAEGAPRGWG